MRKILLVLFLTYWGISAANADVTHLWNEFQYVGLHGGASDSDISNNLFVGINGFYNTHLEHRRGDSVIVHVNNFGIIGSMNYSLKSKEYEHITVSGFITSGYYPSENILHQYGGWSDIL